MTWQIIIVILAVSKYYRCDIYIYIYIYISVSLDRVGYNSKNKNVDAGFKLSFGVLLLLRLSDIRYQISVKYSLCLFNA